MRQDDLPKLPYIQPHEELDPHVVYMRIQEETAQLEGLIKIANKIREQIDTLIAAGRDPMTDPEILDLNRQLAKHVDWIESSRQTLRDWERGKSDWTK